MFSNLKQNKLYLSFSETKDRLTLCVKGIYYSFLPTGLLKTVLKKNYYKRTHNKLNLNDPKRFTEKVQWRKIFDNSDIYSLLSDKYAVRKWVEKKIGADHLIPLLGKWDCADDIDFSNLPSRFVLKTNNGSRTNIVIKDKSKVKTEEIIKKYRYWLKFPFWCVNIEPHYKSIKSCIIAEEFMQEKNGNDIVDYKFYCFNGVPAYCQLITERNNNECIDFFDMEWKHQPFTGLNPKCHNSSKTIDCPVAFSEMKKIAKILSEGFAFVRVDLYQINGKVYFGEMTFSPSGGYGKFTPDKWDYRLGDLWDITIPQIDREKI